MKAENQFAAAVGCSTIWALLFFLSTAAAFGPKFAADFLSGQAAAWVQALGSIAAIVASYRLGAQAHRNELKRIKLQNDDALRNRLAIVIEVFHQAEALDQMMLKFSRVGRSAWWPTMREAARDQLSVYQMVPLFELPEPDLVRHLSLARQSAITYLRWSEMAPTGKVTDSRILGWYTFAEEARVTRREAIACCEKALAALPTQTTT